MKKRIALLFLIAALLFSTLACIGSGEVRGDVAEKASQAEAASQKPSIYATATSAAEEFHIQLTLTAPSNPPHAP